mgnify:FL=1
MARDTSNLKLMALDGEDLMAISAACQDATVKPSDMTWMAADRQLVLTMPRFAWELPSARRRWFPSYERRLSALRFTRVSRVERRNFPNDGTSVLALLAITLEEGHEEGVVVRLTFADDAAMRIHADALEAQLTDLGAAWRTRARPRHSVA